MLTALLVILGSLQAGAQHKPRATHKTHTVKVDCPHVWDVELMRRGAHPSDIVCMYYCEATGVALTVYMPDGAPFCAVAPPR